MASEVKLALISERLPTYIQDTLGVNKEFLIII